MPNVQIRVGVRYLRINDTIYSTAGETTMNLGVQGWTRLQSMDATPPAYTPNREVTPFVETVLRDIESFDVATLLALEDGTLQIELENGKTWVFNQARQTGSGDYNANEGTLAVRFECGQAQEIA